MLAVGVVKPTPAVTLLLVAVGVFHAGDPVIVTPPAVYPDPDTSFVAEYAVVLAFNVAVVKYKAALKTSTVFTVRATLVVLKLCPADRSCPRNDVHIACVFAMIFP
jgi:hypothetical protein